MRKKILYPILIILALIIVAFISPTVVFAENNETETITPPDEYSLGRVIGDDEIADSQLYKSLLQIYNDYYNLPIRGEDGSLITSRLGSVRKNMFNGVDFSKYDGVLDLSGTGGSKNGIVSILGLELIDFSGALNLTKVDLSNNSIGSIGRDSLSSLSFIIELNISNNYIESANLSALTNLKVLIASNNKLTELDLKMIRTEDKSASVDLSKNNFTDLSKITFQRQEVLNYTIDLYLINSLTQIQDLGNNKVNIQAGLVGYDSKVTKYGKVGDLVYYPITNVTGLGLAEDNINLIIKDYNNTDGNAVLTLANKDVQTKQEILQNLPIGKYSVYFEDSNGSSLSSISSYLVDKYDAYIIEVVPTTPEVAVVVDGENIDFNSGDILEKNAVITLSSNEQNAEIWYKINTGEWTKGTSVEIKAGSYAILTVKSVVNGIESREIIYSFKSETGFGWNQLLTIGLCAIGILALFFGLIPLVRYFINKPIVIKTKRKYDE